MSSGNSSQPALSRSSSSFVSRPGTCDYCGADDPAASAACGSCEAHHCSKWCTDGSHRIALSRARIQYYVYDDRRGENELIARTMAPLEENAARMYMHRFVARYLANRGHRMSDYDTFDTNPLSVIKRFSWVPVEESAVVGSQLSFDPLPPPSNDSQLTGDLVITEEPTSSLPVMQ